MSDLKDKQPAPPRAPTPSTGPSTIQREKSPLLPPRAAPIEPPPLPRWDLSPEAMERDVEVQFFTGGGPGGQHRNKSETAVRLRHVPSGVVVVAGNRRSQAQNRADAMERLLEKLRQSMVRPKKRRPTKPTRASKKRRLDDKRKLSEKKQGRRDPRD